MLRDQLRIRVLAVAAGLAAPIGALGEMPAVLDRVPDDAIFVATGSLSEFLNDATKAGNRLGESLPEQVGQGLGMLPFAQLILTQPGFDGAGSAAIVLDLEAGEADEWTGERTPTGVAILPITDFEAFANGPFIKSQASPVNDGMMTLSMQGMNLFLRDLDGFAVVGVDEGLVKDFEAAEGMMDAHATRLGKVGEQVAAANDLFIAAPVSVIKGPLEEQLGMAQQQLTMFAMMGGAGEQSQMLTQALSTVADGFLRDGEIGLAGLSFDEAGISIDLAANFKEGSEVAGFFAGPGDSHAYLNKLPSVPYLMAYAFDLEAEGLRMLINNGFDLMPAPEEDAPDVDPMETLDLTKGSAIVIGSSPAVASAGLLSNTVQYTGGGDPAALATQFKQDILASDGAAQAGMELSASFTDDEKEIAGNTVDGYKVSMQPDPNAPVGMSMVDPSQIQALLFGASFGPSGYLAQTDDGIYVTSGRNSRLLSSALDLGEGGGLSTSERLAAVAKKLPEGRVAEAYIAVDQLVNSLGPVAQMMGAIPSFEQADPMPPIGVGVANDAGGTLLRIHVPSEALTLFGELTAEATPPQAPQGPGDGGNQGPRF